MEIKGYKIGRTRNTYWLILTHFIFWSILGHTRGHNGGQVSKSANLPTNVDNMQISVPLFDYIWDTLGVKMGDIEVKKCPYIPIYDDQNVKFPHMC